MAGAGKLRFKNRAEAPRASVDQPATLRDKVVTHGRLNVARALEYLSIVNPPAIVTTALPAGTRTTTNAPVRVTFNRPMNRAAVESAFVITPAVTGAFVWSADNRPFAFLHDAPFNGTLEEKMNAG
jgi:hypothetical protein